MKKNVAFCVAIMLFTSVISGCGFSIGEEKPVASVSWNNKDGFSTETYTQEETAKDSTDKENLAVNYDVTPPVNKSTDGIILPGTNITFDTFMDTEPAVEDDTVVYHFDDYMQVRYTNTSIPVGDKTAAGEFLDKLSDKLKNETFSDYEAFETINIGQYDLDGEDFYIMISSMFKSNKKLGVYSCLQNVGLDNYVLINIYDPEYTAEEEAVNLCYNIADEFPGKIDNSSNTGLSVSDAVPIIDPAGTTFGEDIISLYIGKKLIDLPKVLNTANKTLSLSTAKDYYVAYNEGNTIVSYSDSYIKVNDDTNAKAWMDSYSNADVKTDEITLNGEKCYVVRVPNGSMKDIHILQNVGAENYISIGVTIPADDLSDKDVLEAFALTIN